MKNNKKLLSKFLTIILSTMMIFSSVLVVNTNVVFALEDEETVEEVAPEKEETIEEEKIEETQTITEKTGDEAQPKEGEEPVLEGNQNFDDVDNSNGSETPMEENDSDNSSVVETMENPFMMMVGGVLGDPAPSTSSTFQTSKPSTYGRHLITYKKPNGVGTYGYDYVEKNAEDRTILYPTTPTYSVNKTSQTFIGWYYREYKDLLGLFYDEVEFKPKGSIGATEINRNITLYPKFVATSELDDYFDIKVNNTRGIIHDDNYSYYNYYKKGDSWALSLITALKSFRDFDNSVEKYDYVMRAEQEETFEGTAFDIAITEANKGDTITLLHDLYIVEPIEIWADVNLDLGGHKIVFNECGIPLNFLHVLDEFRSTDLIIAKDICAAVYVNNSNVTISNGTIDNLHSSGKGVLVTSDYYLWTVKLQDLTVNVKNNMNAIESGYYSYDEGFNINGYVPGYVDVLSGTYNGHVKNNGEGYLKASNGVRFSYDPRYLLSSYDASGVTFDEGNTVFKDNNGYYVDFEPEAQIGETNYKTFIQAVSAVTSGQTIKLLKNVTLDEGAILPITKNCTIDINGQKIINGCIEIQNNAEVGFVGSGTVDTNLNSLNGQLIISGNGRYNNITNIDRNNGQPSSVGHVVISGGNFTNRLPENFIATNYIQIAGDMSGYMYCVIKADEKGQVKLFKRNGSGEYERLVDYIEKNNGSQWKKVTSKSSAPSSPTSNYVFYNTSTQQLLKWNGTNWEEINVEEDTTYRYHYWDETYSRFSNAMTAISFGVIDADKVVLNRDCIVNKTIEIRKPIEIDLNGHNLTSAVVNGERDREQIEILDDEDIEVVASIYVNIEGEGDIIFTNSNTEETSSIINVSDAGDAINVYGIYNVNGNVTIDKVNLTMATLSCSTYNAIYNDSKDSEITINNGSYIMGLADAKEATLIQSAGKVNVLNGSIVEIDAQENSEEIVAINASESDLTVDGSNIVAIGRTGEIAIVYGVKSKGNIYVLNDSMLMINSNNNNAYGIYQEQLSTSQNKEIVIDSNSTLYVEKEADYSNTNVSVYGIYTTTPSSSTKGVTNISIGSNVLIDVFSLDKAYGIYSNGGSVYIGTINGSANNIALNGGFNKETVVGNEAIVENKPDSFNVNTCATIRIEGGDGSVGVCCGYTNKKVVSQLANAFIQMKSTGSKSYCASASTYAIDLLGGYYYTNANNDMFSGNVYVVNGYYNKDVTYYLLKNKMLRELNPLQEYKSNYIDSNLSFKYTTDGSACDLGVKVLNEDELKVEVYITFDPIMLELENRDNYGVQFIVDGLQPYTFTVTESISGLKDSIGVANLEPDNNTQFVYSFSIPAKNMIDNIAIKIVGLKDQAITHVYHSISIYSVKQYYYNMLTNSNNPYVKDLAAASLNFASYAQQYFDYRANNLVNAQLGNYVYLEDYDYSEYFDMHYDDIEQEEIQSEIPLEILTILDKAGHILGLEGSTTLRYEFGLLQGDSIDNFVFKMNGKTITPTFNQTAGRYYIDIENIPTSKLNESYTIDITKDNALTYSVIFSPLDFIISANSGNQDNALLTDLMNAFYQYYMIAKMFN